MFSSRTFRTWSLSTGNRSCSTRSCYAPPCCSSSSMYCCRCSSTGTTNCCGTRLRLQSTTWPRWTLMPSTQPSCLSSLTAARASMATSAASWAAASRWNGSGEGAINQDLS